MAKQRTILDLQQMKERGEQAAWMVIYDSCLASYAEEAGMDMILVGDSMGMIIYGYDGTVPVTMDMSIAHCQGVQCGPLHEGGRCGRHQAGGRRCHRR